MTDYNARLHAESLKRRDHSLRESFNKMSPGKRILLKDGRIGIFHGFPEGDRFFMKGDNFDINFNGEIESVSIRDYVCILIEDENVKCPCCNSHYIMDGFLSGDYSDEEISISKINVRYNEKTTNTTSLNSHSVKCRACHVCGYIMLFTNLEG